MATHSSIPAWKILQRSLVGYSPWGHEESNTTELLTHTHTHTHSPWGHEESNTIELLTHTHTHTHTHTQEAEHDRLGSQRFPSKPAGFIF